MREGERCREEKIDWERKREGDREKREIERVRKEIKKLAEARRTGFVLHTGHPWQSYNLSDSIIRGQPQLNLPLVHRTSLQVNLSGKWIPGKLECFPDLKCKEITFKDHKKGTSCDSYSSKSVAQPVAIVGAI